MGCCSWRVSSCELGPPPPFPPQAGPQPDREQPADVRLVLLPWGGPRAGGRGSCMSTGGGEGPRGSRFCRLLPRAEALVGAGGQDLH